jgi:transcriptional regulator with XRE-family HTH domain
MVNLHGNRGLTAGFLRGIIPDMTHPLRTYRHKVGITLDHLASQVGATKSTLSRIESGARFPSVDLISRLVVASDGLLRADDFLPVRQPLPAQSATVNVDC